MAIIDTHKVFETLTDAGFSKTQAEALLDAVGESHDTLATRADLQALGQKTDAEFANVHASLQALELAVSKCATKTELAGVQAALQSLEQKSEAERRELEMRMTIRLGAMLVVATGLQIAILGFLLALFTGVLP